MASRICLGSFAGALGAVVAALVLGFAFAFWIAASRQPESADSSKKLASVPELASACVARPSAKSDKPDPRTATAAEGTPTPAQQDAHGGAPIPPNATGAQEGANTCGPGSKALCVGDADVLALKADDAGASSGVLRVCNKGDKGEPLRLSVGNFIATSWDGSQYALSPAPAVAVDPNSDTDPVKAANPLATGQCARVRIAATGLADAGPMRATLSQGATPLATIWAFRPTTPFHVNADGSNAGKLVLTVNRASTGAQTAAEIPIVNTDGLSYVVDWTLELADAIISRGQERMAPGQHARLCAVFDAAAVDRLFTRRDSGFITPNRKEGRLLLTRHAEGPMKNWKMDEREIAITASLGYYASAVTQSIWNSLFVFALLLFGVLASLGINFAMPMWRKKVASKQALSVHERSLNGQGSLIDSRALSALRLELRRLWAALSTQWVILPETETVLPALDARIKNLGQRIDITRDARRELAALKGRSLLALHEADEVESLCLSALQIVEVSAPSDADMQKAQTLLTQATALASASLGTPSTEAVAALEKRRSTLVEALADLGSFPPEPADPATAQLPPVLSQSTFAPGAPATQSQEHQIQSAAVLARAQKVWSDLSSRLAKFKTFELDQTPTRSQYIDDSERVWVAERLWQYAKLVKSADTPKLYRDRLDRGQFMLSSLEQGTNWSPAGASQTLQQVAQNVSIEEIASALSKVGVNMPRIVVDPPRPMAFQIAEMRVRLADPGLDTSEARKLITCVWTIDNELLDSDRFCVFQFFEPKGWWVSAFKSRKARRTFKVKATLSHGGKDFPPLDEKEVELTPNRDYFKGSTWLSVASLLITVIVVTVGLLAAAQEKLQTLDAFAGTIALLALGFGADVVKRSLTK